MPGQSALSSRPPPTAALRASACRQRGNFVVAGTVQTWSYDSFGNRTSQGRGGGSPPTAWAAYFPSSNIIAESNKTSTPTVDVDGRLTFDGINRYWWEGQGWLCSVQTTSTGNYYQYIYDTGGNHRNARQLDLRHQRREGILR